MLKYLKATHTVLGLNARNLTYTLPENSREARSIADNKLKAKRILQSFGIPVPKTYAVIRSKEALDTFNWESLPSSFVLKPNRGFGGQGILIVYGEKKRKSPDERREWIKADGSRVSIDMLYTHILNILDGNFSLRNSPDRAYFEQRLKNPSYLKPYLYKGVPSIRVVVFNKVPVIADLKLPTQESNGKANLHAGGVLVGIDIASGITTQAIQHDRFVEVHPDTKLRLSGISIPYWDQILEMAIKAQMATDLGYIGADIALDKEMGPVMLEINARPGLGTQIANIDGLKQRLERVQKLKIKTPKKGIRVAKELFGGEVEEEVETLLGKKMIGLYVKTILHTREGNNEEVMAKVDTGATYTSIDRELAEKIGYSDTIRAFERYNISQTMSYEEAKDTFAKLKDIIPNENPEIVEITLIKSSTGNTIRPIIDASFTIEDVTINTHVTIINRKHLKYPMIIGAKNLTDFIIDTSKQ